MLISGVLEQSAYGADPTQGVVYGLATGLAYTGFILVLRAGSGERQRVAGPLFDATLVAALVAVVAGLVIGDADLVPSWPAHAWLATLALTSQVIGWLLISASLPRLPAAQTSSAADDPARGLGHPRRDPLRRGAVGAAARRRRPDPRGPGDGRARASAAHGGDLGSCAPRVRWREAPRGRTDARG